MSKHWTKLFPTKSGTHAKGFDRDGKIIYESHTGLNSLAEGSSEIAKEAQKELQRRNKKRKFSQINS